MNNTNQQAFWIYVDQVGDGRVVERTKTRTLEWMIGAITGTLAYNINAIGLFNGVINNDNDTIQELSVTDDTALVDHIIFKLKTVDISLDVLAKDLQTLLSNSNKKSTRALLANEKTKTRGDHTYYNYLLLIPTDVLLNKKGYQSLSKALKKDLLAKLPYDTKPSTSQTFNAPLHQYSPSVKAQIKVLNADGNDWHVATEIKKKANKQQSASIRYSSNMLNNRLKAFVNERQTKIWMNNPEMRHQIFLSLAHDTSGDSFKYPDGFANSVIKALSNQNEQEYANLYTEFQQCQAELKTHPAIAVTLRRFGNYFGLYNAAHTKGTNLSQNLLEMISESFEPNSEIKIAEAAEVIANIYPPALLKGSGPDRERVVIFNPLTGVWEHDDNEFYALLTAVRPYSTQRDYQTMIYTFAAKARNAENVIEPYHYSQHILFKNGVLDVSTMEFHDLNETYVKNLNLTENLRLNINYNPTVVNAPVFENELKFHEEGGNANWDPYHFVSAYAGNDPAKLQYFMFGLSLGLFPGHNFGVHFDIQGDARWGKTTLANIFISLYDENVMFKPFESLNDQFAFTSYKPNTSIIWINECNTDIKPLNREYGIPLYDGLADKRVTFQRKGNDDFTLVNPPQVFIDGTGTIPATDINTGPGGRTLVFKLPSVNENTTKADIIKLQHQAYAKHIDEMLSNEQVLQWLVNMMVKAYRTTLKYPESDRDSLNDLKLNLGGTDNDTKLLPPFALQWRREMTNSQNDLADWFSDRFEPYINAQAVINDPNNINEHQVRPTIMHDSLAYQLYKANYEAQHRDDDPQSRNIIPLTQFKREFRTICSNHGWQRINASHNKRDKRRQISKPTTLNFDFQGYQEDNGQLPKQLTDQNNLAFPFGRKERDWYYLTKNQN